MKKNNQMNKTSVGLISFISCFFIFTGYSIPIKIKVNGQNFKECDYSLLRFVDGNTTELTISTNSDSGETCGITGPTGGSGGSPGNPSPVSPIGLQNNGSGAPVKTVSEFRWKMVEGATRYNIMAFTGLAAFNPTTSNIIYNRTLNSGGSSAVQQENFAAACGGVSVGGDCVITGPVYFGGGFGYDLADGNYQWQVRVEEADAPGAVTSFSDATASFLINAEVSTAATESTSGFAAAWVNQIYNPATGENNFATKTQLRTMLDTAPYNGYQEIAGNKKVYIVNNSISSETVIPSCVNGKLKMPQGQSGSNCTVDIPFELNDIFALRLKTRNTGRSGVLNKASNQLYPYEGAIYNVTLSKYPGRMVANQADDFQGNCSTTSINLIGEFSLYTAQSGNASTFCIVPDNTQLYANVELASNQTQCVAGPGPSGYVCQLDINLNGFATSNN